MRKIATSFTWTAVIKACDDLGIYSESATPKRYHEHHTPRAVSGSADGIHEGVVQQLRYYQIQENISILPK